MWVKPFQSADLGIFEAVVMGLQYKFEGANGNHRRAEIEGVVSWPFRPASLAHAFDFI
jgi:hypothetical protein